MKTAKEYLLKRDHLLYNILQPYPKEGFIHIFIDSQIQWNKKTWCSIMSSKHRQASADWIFTNLRKHCRNRCRSQSLHCTAVFIAVLFILVWFDSHINPLLLLFFSHFLLSELFLIWTDYVQAVRGLLMCGLTIGFFAVVCCFVGMECTYIGGSDKTKDKVLFAGAVLHFVGGKLWTYAVLLSVNVLPSFFSSVHRNLFTQVCQTLLPTAYTSTELPGQLLLERSHQEFCGTAFSTPYTILHKIFLNYRHICYKFCSNLYYLNDSMIFSLSFHFFQIWIRISSFSRIGRRLFHPSRGCSLCCDSV